MESATESFILSTKQRDMRRCLSVLAVTQSRAKRICSQTRPVPLVKAPLARKSTAAGNNLIKISNGGGEKNPRPHTTASVNLENIEINNKLEIRKCVRSNETY